jgi:hypothetical protein
MGKQRRREWRRRRAACRDGMESHSWRYTVIARRLIITTGIIASVVTTACDSTPSSPLASDLAPAASVASRSSENGEALHVTKECSQYQGRIGDFCTITRSNVKEIRKDDRVFYLAALNFADPSGLITYDGDVRVVTRNGTAYGHCIITDFAKALGTCRFSGGTAKFRGFSAKAAVTGDAKDPLVAHWDGYYRFANGERDDD